MHKMDQYGSEDCIAQLFIYLPYICRSTVCKNIAFNYFIVSHTQNKSGLPRSKPNRLA